MIDGCSVFIIQAQVIWVKSLQGIKNYSFLPLVLEMKMRKCLKPVLVLETVLRASTL